MRSRRVPVVVALAVMTAASWSGPPAAGGQEGQVPAGEGTDRYIVVLGDPAGAGITATEADPDTHADSVGVEPVQVYEHALDGYAADLTAGEVDDLEDDARVAYVEEVVEYELDQAEPPQSVPTGARRAFLPDNPGVDIGGQDRRVDVDIAVMDTGVNDHVDLDVVDRVHCYAPGGCVAGGFDDLGHGTHVAGIAAAADNGVGVVGIAPGARVWSQKVCNAHRRCSTDAILAAVDYVTAHADEIEVANMSLGGSMTSQAVSDAITASVDAGVIYAVAAGNEGIDAAGQFPANHPDVITVSALADSDGLPGGVGGPPGCWASSQDDHLADFSNWGATIELTAPGTCINSTSFDGGYELLSGTSMAAPHVAGAAALLASGADSPSGRADVLAVRDTLVAEGNLDWFPVPPTAADPQEPLLDVHDGTTFSPTMTGNAPRPWAPAAAVPGGTFRFAHARCTQDPSGYYTFGGEDTDLDQVSSSWRYDSWGDTWEELAPYPGGPVTGAAATCTGDGKVHVVGGSATLDHHVYDIATDTWSAAAPLPRTAWLPAAGSWDGKVVVVGGRDGPLGNPSQTVDIYDIATDTWRSTLALQPVAGAGYAQSGRYLYLTGGWGSGSPATGLSSTVRFDMALEAWSGGPGFPSARYGHSLVATDAALYAVGGYSSGSTFEATEVVERLDLTAWPTSQWEALEPLPTPLGWLGATCSPAGPHAGIDAVGGIALNRESPAARDEHWHMDAYGEACAPGDWDTWEPAATVPGGTIGSGFTQCAQDPDGYYKVAGWTGNGAKQASSWRYDAGSGSWDELAPYPVAGGGISLACTADGKIHAVGGDTVNGPNASTDHYVYDITTDTWQAAAPLPTGIAFAAMGAWGGKVYVAGGAPWTYLTTPTDAVWAYDIATDTWSAAAPLPEATSRSGHAQVGSSLYVVGGTDGYASMDAVQRFDMATGTWSSGPSLPAGRDGMAVVATDTALYALGGIGANDRVATVSRLEFGSWPAGGWTGYDALPLPQSMLGGWCAPTGTGVALGAAGGYNGTWYSTSLGKHWRSAITGEACAF